LKTGITKEYKSAVAIVDKVLLVYPLHYDALIIRANCSEWLNYNLDAIEDYEKALSIDNSDANIYGLLGLVYKKIGELDIGQEKLKISIQKNGLTSYEMSYNMLLKASDELRQVLIERAKKPDNLLRRNPNDFVDDLTEADKMEFLSAIKNNLPILERELLVNPNNTELRKLYEFAKIELNEQNNID
jgi:tetratricopeptide (TPR) repeat protein